MTEQIQTEWEEININTDVLVIGSGYTGLAAAREISASGYPVILVSSDSAAADSSEIRPLEGLEDSARKELAGLAKEVESDSNIKMLKKARLVDARGVPGDFTVRLAYPQKEEVEEKVGAIVIATEFFSKPANGAYNLALSDRILSLSQFEEMIKGPKKDTFSGKTIAFVFGFAGESTPLAMEKIFRAVLAAESLDDCTPYVYAGNLKVASEGLERLFLESRDRGANYFKLNQPPVIDADGSIITFTDPVTNLEMEAAPDYIIIEEELKADAANERLSNILRIDAGPGNFLQTENVHRFPVRSNREGIFVIGGSRDIQGMPAAIMDVDNAVLEIKNLLKDGRITTPKNKALLDIGKCTFCITCYRCCPHGAIYWDETNKPVISLVACQACGICASECPMDAIQIGSYTDAEIMDLLKSTVEAETANPRIVAFCCQNSAYEAGLMAESFGLELPANLQIIRVPCAGKVDLEYILNAFVEGAEGVLVMTCHPGNCLSEKGNTYAKWRVEDAQRRLSEIGMEPERLGFVTLASNMGSDFSSAVIEMRDKLNDLKT
ncbi:MAG: hydrogenase iron-sulfur subunit [Desulfobacterales bacterium]